MLGICLGFLIFTNSVKKEWIKKTKTSNIKRLASVNGSGTSAYIHINWRAVKTQIAEYYPKVSNSVDLRWGPRICMSQKGPGGTEAMSLKTTLWEILVYFKYLRHPETRFTPMSIWFQNFCVLADVNCPQCVYKWTIFFSHISGFSGN